HPDLDTFPTRRSSDLAAREHRELPAEPRPADVAATGQERRVVRGAGGRLDSVCLEQPDQRAAHPRGGLVERAAPRARRALHRAEDRKSTRLNSSHEWI